MLFLYPDIFDSELFVSFLLFPRYILQILKTKEEKERGRQRGKKKKSGKLGEDAGFLTSFECETTDDSGVESQDEKLYYIQRLT